MRWTRAEWSDEAEAALGKLIQGDRARTLRHIEEGKAELFRIEGEAYDGWLLTRIEELLETGTLELHVLAFAGRGSRALLEDLKRIAKASGCESVRCEASEPAVQRLWSRIGFDEIERVYRVMI